MKILAIVPVFLAWSRFLRFYPNTSLSFSAQDWEWKPSQYVDSWPLKKGGVVRYAQCSWLCLNLNFNNED